MEGEPAWSDAIPQGSQPVTGPGLRDAAKLLLLRQGGTAGSKEETNAHQGPPEWGQGGAPVARSQPREATSWTLWGRGFS